MWFILGALLSISLSFAQERILLFHSEITVQPDASLEITEMITVQATGDTINHGIVREFPTKYKDKWGNTYNVVFTLRGIRRDGQPEAYHVSGASNGKKIYIGSKEVWLEPKTYTYAISYATNRQLGFFDDHDELYWNVTGNGWRLPIEKAVAIVHLPLVIPRDQLQLEAYTGRQGSKKQYSTARIDSAGNCIFETTLPLRSSEGLTIVASWPKGYIMPPSSWQEWYWFFKDNLHIFIAIMGLLSLLVWYLFAWLRVRATQTMDTVIPLFYPSEGMTPGLMRYIMRMKYDGEVLAADIVDMAVHGYLTIEYIPGFFKHRYVLHKKEISGAEVPYYTQLSNKLFGKHATVVVNEEQAPRIAAAVELEKQRYDTVCRAYFQLPGKWIAGGIGLSLLCVLLLLTLIDQDGWYVLCIAVFLYSWLSIWFYSLLRGYSPKGLAIKKEIDGFKMFLATTEEERLKIIGTPPTRTPELYEKYLPYAIALGVEKQWSRQFAPLFEEMRKQGHPYVAVWYGGDFHTFNGSAFASTISSSISSSIAAASYRPGSNSGSGGRGSSGGGGGGGGGGGW